MIAVSIVEFRLAGVMNFMAISIGSATVLPLSPCDMGQQPVAMDADDARVADGKIPRWSANQVPACRSRAMCGVISSDTKSGRCPSQMTVTTIGCDIGNPF